MVSPSLSRCRDAWRALLDIDAVLTILLFHAPDPVVYFADHLDRGVFPFLACLTWVLLVAHGAWAVPAKVVAAFWVPLLIKECIRRARPFVVMGWVPRRRATMFRGPDAYSFPSGHAAVATVLLWEGWQAWGAQYPWWSLTAVWGALSLARVALGVHWFGDVVGGWAVGYVVSRAFG